MVASSLHQSVLVIHDDRKGHLNPSLAVAEIIQEKYSCQFQKYLFSQHLNKKLISLFKKISHFPYLFKLLGKLIFKVEPQNIKDIEVIICSGMPNLIYAAYLAHRYNILLLYVGNLRGFNDQLIDFSITALPQNVNCKQIILNTPPVSAKFSSATIQPNHQAVLLLGGSTKEYPLSKQQFTEIITHFVHFTQTKQLEGTIICSRRTPELSEKVRSLVLAQNIKIIDAQQNIEIYEQMIQSKFIFVTEDSITMLSEAIHTGAIVTSICLDELETTDLIEKYLDKKYIQRKSIQHLGQISEHYSSFNRTELTQTLIQQLAPFYHHGHFKKNELEAKKHKVYA